MNRKFIIAGIVAGACLGAAGPAGATTVPLQFNHVVLDTPATPNAQIVTPSTQPLTVNADVNLSTGQFTVQPSDFTMPAYNFTSPAPGSATISLKNPASGQVFPDGSLTLNADLLATINIQGYGSCTKDTGPITLSTSTTQPLQGVKFAPAGPTAVATGTGAFGYGWSTLAPGTGPACSLIDGATAGKGGFWVSRNISPVPPALALSTSKLKENKPGTTTAMKVTVKVKNNNDANPVKVCLVAAKGLSPKSKCQTISSLTMGKNTTLTFKVKSAKTDKKGKYALKLTASGKGVTTVRKTVKLQVK